MGLTWKLGVLVMLCMTHVRVHTSDNVSINTNGDIMTATSEEVKRKRMEEDVEDAFIPMMYARGQTTAASSDWGGGAYSTPEQKALLQAHNDHRKEVIPSSSDMNELLWSSKLAIQAQKWSDGCVYAHPDKTVHTDYVGVGQNLYIKWLDEGGRNRPDAAQPVQLWYDEVKDFDYPQNECRRGAVCGHFTQVVWAETTQVGCGITFCPLATGLGGKEYPNAWLVTCNYSPAGNMRGQKPYVEGQHCAACPSGFCRKELCSKCKKGEKGCECNLDCQNCGTLNRKKCKCNCVAGYYGPACENRCEDTDARCGGNPGWPKFWCNNSNFPFVTEKCPALCGVCEKGRGRPSC